jgi:hypothetical protein
MRGAGGAGVGAVGGAGSAWANPVGAIIVATARLAVERLAAKYFRVLQVVFIASSLFGVGLFFRPGYRIGAA